jgi:hypothetical protein
MVQVWVFGWIYAHFKSSFLVIGVLLSRTVRASAGKRVGGDQTGGGGSAD